jgi:hypothetical protein
MCLVHEPYKKHIGGGITLFPCLGLEFVAALLERSVKKAEGSMMRRPTKRYEAFYKLTSILKRVWKNNNQATVHSLRRVHSQTNILEASRNEKL